MAMYCPSCRGEFRPEITVCPDCDVSLVAALPEAVMDSDEPVSVYETADVAALPAIKSALDAAGIPYLIQGDEAFGLLPLSSLGGNLSPRGLGVAVLVPRGRSAEAAELLATQAIEKGDT